LFNTGFSGRIAPWTISKRNSATESTSESKYVDIVWRHELGHIWPPEAALREEQIKLIERFAAQNGLAVTIRDIGINATFKKKAAPDE
jgi:hypothetical protein